VGSSTGVVTVGNELLASLGKFFAPLLRYKQLLPGHFWEQKEEQAHQRKLLIAALTHCRPVVCRISNPRLVSRTIAQVTV